MSSRSRFARRAAAALVLAAGAVSRGGTSAADVEGYTLAVAPAETTLAQFTTVNITASAFGQGVSLDVTLDGVVVASGTSAADHSFDPGDVAVPAGAANCGTDTVDLNDLSTDETPFVAAARTIAVYCPTVQVTPSQIDSGGGPASFTVSGTGYPPFRDVVLTLDNAQSGFDDTSTDGNGAFTRPTSRPALSCGTHQLTATAQPPPVIQSVHAGPPSTVSQFPPLPASTTFTVTGCATQPPVTQPPPSEAPKIVANPAVIIDGMLTHVTGTGFPPGQQVTLTWETDAAAVLSPCSPDAVSAPPLVADAQGDIDTYCLARPHEVLGAAQIVALPGAVNAALMARVSVTHVAAPVVVEGGSMQPSSGDQFVFRR